MTWGLLHSFVMMTSPCFLSILTCLESNRNTWSPFLYSLLPPLTTVVCLYDVGCVLDRSMQLVRPPVNILYKLLTVFYIYIVWHSTPSNHIVVAICNIRDACLWASMGLPTCLQPLPAAWPWIDGWGRYRETVVLAMYVN